MENVRVTILELERFLRELEATPAQPGQADRQAVREAATDARPNATAPSAAPVGSVR